MAEIRDAAYREAIARNDGNILAASRDLGLAESTLHRWKQACKSQVVGAGCVQKETDA
jgi:transcriptional regulator of acetoin/glycerol metabolism